MCDTVCDIVCCVLIVLQPTSWLSEGAGGLTSTALGWVVQSMAALRMCIWYVHMCASVPLTAVCTSVHISRKQFRMSILSQHDSFCKFFSCNNHHPVSVSTVSSMVVVLTCYLVTLCFKQTQ